MGLSLSREAKVNFKLPIFYLNAILDQAITLGRSEIADFTLLHTTVVADDIPEETLSLSFAQIEV